jgi:transposase
MQPEPTEFLEFTRQELDEFIGRMVTRQARDADYDMTAVMAESYFYLVEQIRLQCASLRRLRQMLFGARTEKTSTVLGTAATPASTPPPAPPADTSPSAPPSGHGRRAADAYGGATRVAVPHPSLHAGDPCPECQHGTLYRTSRPKVLLRITGHAPVQAHVYELERLRCNLCGKLFTAPTPEGVGTHKYDATTGSMIGLLKYGSGFPFNRLARLRRMCDIPLTFLCQPPLNGT